MSDRRVTVVDTDLEDLPGAAQHNELCSIEFFNGHSTTVVRITPDEVEQLAEDLIDWRLRHPSAGRDD